MNLRLVIGLVAGVLLATTLDSLSQRVVAPGTGINKIGSSMQADTIYLLTQSTAQTGKLWQCLDTSGVDGVHSCAMVSVLPAPTTRPAFLVFTPGFSASGMAECLNVNGLGCTSLVERDGVSNPAANSYVKGVPIVLLYSASLKAGAGAFVVQ